MITARQCSSFQLPFALLLLSAAAVGQGTGMAWSTFFGGPDMDIISIGSGKRILGNGDILIYGSTRSSKNFPLKGPAQSTHGGASDGFVARLRGDGSGLVWSTYLGGSANDTVRGATVDVNGVITVCGSSQSTDFPTTSGAFRTATAGKTEGFVTRMVWNGSKLQILWSTYLGGSLHDSAANVLVHPNGSVVVAGTTESTNFPMQGSPYQKSNAGSYDGFLAVLDSTGRKLLASTYLGGRAHDFDNDIVGNEWSSYIPLLLDSAGNPIIIGASNSTNMKTTPGAFQTALPLPGGIYIGRLDIGLSKLSYGSFLGNDGIDLCWDATIDAQNRLTLTGTTTSKNFPTTPGAFQRTFSGGNGCGPVNYAGDGFVTTLDTSKQGSAQLIWSTYLGTSGCDVLQAVAVDRCGLVTVAGQTGSGAYITTPGAYQRTNVGWTDACITRFDPSRSGKAQVVYSTYLGGSSGDNAIGIDVDDLGNAVVFCNTFSSNLPTTTGSLQPIHAGSWDGSVTKLTMLPKPMRRFGFSTPACLMPIHQGAYSAPVAGNKNFGVYACGAPASGIGVIVIGSPTSPGIQLLNARLFLRGPLVVIPSTTNPAGRASFFIPVPTPRPNVSIGSQWLFLTTSSCPGSGPLASSEGLWW